MRALSSIALLVTSTMFSGLSSAAITYKEVAPIVTQACTSCHNSTDTAYGELALDTEFLLNKSAEKVLLAIKGGFMPIGEDGFADSPEGKALIEYLETLSQTTEPVYSEIATILQTNCVSCHGPNKAKKGVRLDTESNVLKFAKAARLEILNGSMPPKNPNFSKTEEGLKLLQWLSKE